jgi:hypothetical protein
MPVGPLPLIAHPARPARGVLAVRATVSEGDGLLNLRFEVDHVPGALRIASQPGAPERLDGLWTATCLEAFVADASGTGYREFNFAPCGHWAAYRFSGYRDRMEMLAGVKAPPSVALRSEEDRTTVAIRLGLPGRFDGRLALTAVLEDVDRSVSYWSLRHPPGDAPDFHHSDNFALNLPRAS